MADVIEVRREQSPTKGRYVAVVDGHEAEMTYSRAGEGLIIIDHTSVPDALRGRSVGQALVKKAVEDARAEGKKILPLCPFAKAQIGKHVEWQDVLQK
jgi:predicted GNAT family acetyltransferase